MPHHPGEFEKIFDTCLESLLSGRENLDSLIAKYPYLEIELRPLLEAALTLTYSKRLFEPAPDFIQRSRRNLVRRIQSEPRAPVAGIAARLASLWGSLLNVRLSPRLAAATIMLAVLAILFTGGGAVALLAQASIPGDMLYPVKNAVEDLRLTLVSNPADQASLHLTIASRRAAEIETLSQENRWGPVQDTVLDYEWHLSEATRQIKRLLPQDAGRARALAESLEQMMVAHRVLLGTAARGMPEQARQFVEHALSLNEDHLLFAHTVIEQVDSQIVIGTPTATSTATATPTPTSPAPTFSAFRTVTLPAKTVTGTPASPSATSPTSPALTATRTLAPSVQPTTTVTPQPEPTIGEEEGPTPTKKPTKTPRTLPDPTRRPPHPTSKPGK